MGRRSKNTRWLTLVVILLVASSWTRQASAQTAREDAKKHVGKELDKKKGKKRKRNANRSGRRGSAGHSGASDGPTYTLALAEDPELAKRDRSLPRRLLPSAQDYLSFDLKVDGAYRGWLPQQYDSAEVDIASYATWRVGVKARFFKHLALYRGYYESTGLVTPRNTSASIAAKVGGLSPKAAKVLGYIGLTFWKRVHPIIRYQAQSFSTSATPNLPVCIVGRNDSVDATNCPRTTDDLEMTSSFETFVAGIRYVPSQSLRTIFATRDGKLPPFYVGLGLMSYSKPYQINVDGATLEDYLFDARFRGAGFAFGTTFGGGARRFFGGLDMQVGLGQVQLTDNFTLNEVTPDDWLIGYIQGNLRAGYRMVLFKGPPTIYFTPTATVGGASFHFVSTSGEANSAPSLNWDLLWSTRASLEVAL